MCATLHIFAVYKNIIQIFVNKFQLFAPVEKSHYFLSHCVRKIPLQNLFKSKYKRFHILNTIEILQMNSNNNNNFTFNSK